MLLLRESGEMIEHGDLGERCFWLPLPKLSVLTCRTIEMVVSGSKISRIS